MYLIRKNKQIFFFLILTFICSSQLWGQVNPKIVRTFVYHVIKEFQDGDVFDTKMSADGSKIIFADYATKIYTINSDGTDQKTIYDFEQRVDPWIDISANGSKVVLGPKYGGYCYGIIILNSDGGQRVTVNSLPKGDGTTFTPLISVRPRITADGSKVYFCNVGGGEDKGGIWRVNADGSNPEQLISYTAIRNQYNISYNQDWGNYLFHPEFDISDDGSHIIFPTTIVPSQHTYKLMAFDGANLRILLEPIDHPSRGCATISGDGKKVVAIKSLGGGSTAIYAINFDGSNPLELASDNYSTVQLQLTRDGSKLFVHWAGTSGSSFIINTKGTDSDNLGIVQTPWLISGTKPFRAVHLSNISADGKRINFAAADPILDRLRRIWVAEIDPPSLGNAPLISDVNMKPIWVLTKGRSKSTFSAKVSSGGEPISEVGYSSFPKGLYRNVFSSYHQLHDTGMNGDVTAGDGIYTYDEVTTNATEETAEPIPVRFSAWTANHVTSVVVLPFFVVEQDPTGPAPTITSIDPTSAEPGSQITITGTGFNPTASQNVVIIGNRSAYVVSATATQLVVEVPSELPSGTYPITVSANGKTSNAATITVGSGPTDLNPPRNLEAYEIENIIVLYWDPPSAGDMAKLNQTLSNIDEIEPNNSPAQAQALTGSSPIIVNGNVEITDMGISDDGSDDIEDLFRVKTTSTGLKINLSSFVSDCDLYLYDAYGSLMIDASIETGAGIAEEIDYSDLEPGIYVIGVSIYDSDPQGPNQTPYTLSLTGQFGDVPPIDNLISYNLYRSTTPNARLTGTLVANLHIFETYYEESRFSHQDYYYQVTAVYDQGESGPSNEATVLYTIVAENQSAIIPDKFALGQNYPNPFNPLTTISYSLPTDQFVKLKIYNLSGQEILTLVERNQPAGNHQVKFDGNQLSSGLYIYKLQTNEFSDSKKFILMK